MLRRAFLLLLVLTIAGFASSALVSCSGIEARTGLEEPLRVRNGTFKKGLLPGEPPVATPPGPPPAVTSLETPSTVVRPGQTEKSLVGRTSTDAVAIALRFDDLGSGYWVLPVDAPDPGANGELVWQALTDFGESVPPGIHPLHFVAIDATGHAGAQRALSVCVSSLVPDNLNACDAKRAPPAAVLALSWDTPVDLDLVVVTPEGRVVDAKHPRTTAPPPPGPVPTTDAGATAAAAGTFDRDSNGGCAIDGVQREHLVFDAPPPGGSYLVYANLFDSCGAAPVHFTFSLYEPVPAADGQGQELAATITKRGALNAVDANGGAKVGTFVTEVTF